MAKTGPIEYIRQVRAEMKKITWTPRKDVTISTILVFIMVAVSSVFLFAADQAMAFIVHGIINFGM